MYVHTIICFGELSNSCIAYIYITHVHLCIVYLRTYSLQSHCAQVCYLLIRVLLVYITSKRSRYDYCQCVNHVCSDYVRQAGRIHENRRVRIYQWTGFFYHFNLFLWVQRHQLMHMFIRLTLFKHDCEKIFSVKKILNKKETLSLHISELPSATWMG